MALICSLALSANSYVAGSTPPPVASVICRNDGDTALVVTGVQLKSRVIGSSTLGNPTTMGAALPPYGPGAPVTVAAGSSGAVGPFVITAACVAANVGGLLQPSQPTNYQLAIGATVTASDRSISEATEAYLWVTAPLCVNISSTQGGQFIYSRPINSAWWFFQ